ncbi:unnamed protein product, partial [Ectocarpus sp. 12 AP-2014]
RKIVQNSEKGDHVGASAGEVRNPQPHAPTTAYDSWCRGCHSRVLLHTSLTTHKKFQSCQHAVQGGPVVHTAVNSVASRTSTKKAAMDTKRYQSPISNPSQPRLRGFSYLIPGRVHTL